MRNEVAEQMDERRDAELLSRLADALADPLRARLMAAVTEKPGISIRQIAERIGEPERKVRYHVEALHSAGLVEVQGLVRRRGAVERRYRATTSMMIDAVDAERISEAQQRRISLEVLKMIMGDATVSVASGHFGTHPGHSEIRLRGEIDEEGWRELAEIHLRAMEDAQAAIDRSTERRRTTGEEGFEVTSAALLFEAPIWKQDRKANGPSVTTFLAKKSSIDDEHPSS
jgi:DNA-binding transcriptional ArsR family regulator